MWLEAISDTNLLAFGILYLLLILATIITISIKSKIEKKQYIELKERVRSWWFIITFFILALIISKTTMIVFFAFVSFLALKEYFSIIPTRQIDRRVIFIAYISIVFQYVWVGTEWYGMFVIFIPVYLFLLIPARMVILGETKGFLKASSTLQWGLMLTVYCLSYISYLGMLPFAKDPVNSGISLILYLAFLTQFNDVAQYCWGKFLGRKKITPKVSPNKTTAGFLGGIGTTMLLSLLISPFLTQFTWPIALVSGFLISFAGFIGDLTMSAIKRDLGIKDTGNILPGHGGILDRLDSIIFTAPLFFHYVRYLYY